MEDDFKNQQQKVGQIFVIQSREIIYERFH